VFGGEWTQIGPKFLVPISKRKFGHLCKYVSRQQPIAVPDLLYRSFSDWRFEAAAFENQAVPTVVPFLR
jgi:hypothetical protein